MTPPTRLTNRTIVSASAETVPKSQHFGGVMTPPYNTYIQLSIFSRNKNTPKHFASGCLSLH